MYWVGVNTKFTTWQFLNHYDETLNVWIIPDVCISFSTTVERIKETQIGCYHKQLLHVPGFNEKITETMFIDIIK